MRLTLAREADQRRREQMVGRPHGQSHIHESNSRGGHSAIGMDFCQTLPHALEIADHRRRSCNRRSSGNMRVFPVFFVFAFAYAVLL